MLLVYLISLLLHSPKLFLIAILVLVIPLLISITVHEWSHGMLAYLFGDPTPKEQGRLSFNPFAHLDPLGTIMLFIIGIGWAKPVEINPNNIPGKTKQMLVAIAGPASNLIMAIIFSLIYYGIDKYVALTNSSSDLFSLMVLLVGFIIQINVILTVFNMLPIPPLDGSKFVMWFLPENISEAYSKLAPFGMIILLLILFTVGFGLIFDVAKIVQNYIFRIIELILNPIFS